MPKSVHITAPWPTHEERVGHLRISKTRQRELQVFVDEFKNELSSRKETSVRPNTQEKRLKRASAA
jgi:hypothetical protein